MKILNSTAKNFDKSLDSLLLERKKKLKSSSVSVSNIIKDVKKNGDKALLLSLIHISEPTRPY